MSAQTLHFTLGPVQGFVAQARRTRDLWAGSFLLSYLSGHAMAAALQAGGRIVFPLVEKDGKPVDHLLRAIAGDFENDNRPRIATLPNRFKAFLPEGTDPAVCEKAVRVAWHRIAGEIWEKFVTRAAAKGNDTREIWERQVAGFWEIAWIVGESDDLLDRRKNWRSNRPTVEGGDQCTIMSGWQELSGFVRARKNDRKTQDAFWKTVRDMPRLGRLDLREGERLCAMALIKRLFPRVSKEAIGWKVEVANWPSTPYMAAVPFIDRVLETHPDAATAYSAVVPEGKFGEMKTEIACLKPSASPFKALDGDLLFLEAITESKTRTPELGAKDSPERVTLAEALQALYKETKLEPRPFYAMLFMDGDSMGAMLGANRERQADISAALGAFTDQVPRIVTAADGVTIYAGGDDALALLPLDSALAAARNLSAAYREAFIAKAPGIKGQDGQPAKASISAGIILAHYGTPLLEVMQLAHHALEGLAKEQMGRDAVAVEVFKGSGLNSVWAAKWEHLNDLEDLLASFRKQEVQEPNFSNKFLYTVHETLRMLSDKPRGERGEAIVLPKGLAIRELLVADYLQARECWESGVRDAENSAKRKSAEQNVGLIMNVCAGKDEAEGTFKTDGLFLVRFLAQNIMRD